jgi:hypothetical protein
MTKKMIIAIVLSAITINNSFAQKSFAINNSSKTYNAKVEVEKCDNEACGGKGIVKLYLKNSDKLLQEFNSGDLSFNLDKKKNPSTKMELYDEQSPVVFGDFNFDGTEDLAIRNGSNSGYGGPSYDVYVYVATKKQFILSKELTKLASTNLGMFEVDGKRKRIITLSKSGAAWHLKTEYEIIPEKGLLKVYELEEDASKGDDYVYVTEKKYVKGKWNKSTKKYKIKDYYK